MSWPMVKLCEIVDVMHQGINTAADKVIYADSGMPIIQAKHLKDDCLTLDDAKFLNDSDVIRYQSKYIPKFNDILFSNIGTIGKSVIVNEVPDFMFAWNVFVIRPKHNLLDVSFLKYFLDRLLLEKYYDRFLTGGTVKFVNKKVMGDIEVPLPPLAEQKRIAAILDKADAIRRKRQQAIQLADDFLRAVFLEMFGDPVTNPKGWEVKPMKLLVKIQGGYAFKSEDFSEFGIPVVKIGNANKVGFTTKGISFIQPDSPNKLKQYELYVGDLLMSLTGTVGKDDYANITEVTDEFDMYYLNQRVAKITVDEGKISKNYIKFYLSHPKIKTEITKNNRGVRQANIGNADIYSLIVPTPSSDLLTKFDKLVEQTTLLITTLKLAPAQSDSFFRALSQKAFSGQL